MRRLAAAVILCGGVLVAGCGEDGQIETPTTPSPATIVSETLTGEVSGGDAPCYVGNACWTHDFVVDHDGRVDAVLTWEKTSLSSYLYLHLYDRTSQRILVDASDNYGGSSQTLSTNVRAGARLQWRVVFAGGTTITAFTLAVTRPN